MILIRFKHDKRSIDDMEKGFSAITWSSKSNLLDLFIVQRRMYHLLLFSIGKNRWLIPVAVNRHFFFSNATLTPLGECERNIWLARPVHLNNVKLMQFVSGQWAHLGEGNDNERRIGPMFSINENLDHDVREMYYEMALWNLSFSKTYFQIKVFKSGIWHNLVPW